MLLITLPYLMAMASAYQCGWQAPGKSCPRSMCCSRYGYCGSTRPYCGIGNCQSQCLLNVPAQAQAEAQAWAKAQAAQAQAALAQVQAQVQAQPAQAGTP